MPLLTHSPLHMLEVGNREGAGRDREGDTLLYAV